MEDTKTRRVAMRKLREIATSFGIRVRRDRSASVSANSTYTGRTVNLGNRDDCLFTSDLAHELGHYITTPKEYRHLREFGYEASYESTMIKSPRRWGSSDEEPRASATGIWLLVNVGDRDCAVWTLQDHSWDFDTFVEQTKELLELGVLYRDCNQRLRVNIEWSPK